MYPHERSLVKRLQDKPFAILGVNSDTDRAALEKTLVKEQLNWRSWWNGGGKKGPISAAWNIQFWPTIYVIDGKGIIRYKNVQDKRLDEALDKLMAEIERH